MAKATSTIYTDVQAIDESDKGQKTTNQYLREIAYAMANFATAMEAINNAVAGPTNTVTAASLYSRVEALDSSDPDRVMNNFYWKEIGLLASKLAMEAESIQASFGAQVKTKELTASMSLVPTLDVDAKMEYVKGVLMALGASIDLDYTQKLTVGASLGVSGRVWQALLTEYTGFIGNYDKAATMTLTPTIATLHTPAP